MRLLHVLVIAVSLASCQRQRPGPATRSTAPSAVVSASAAPPSPTAESPTAEKFGAPLSDGEYTPLQSVLAHPKDFETSPVRVEGTVRRACTRKGCWMELSDPVNESQRCRVTFKDYGFFVPTDSAGARAKVEGRIVTKLVTAGHVEHLEGEGAVFPNKHADGSAMEVRLVATGVELVR